MVAPEYMMKAAQPDQSLASPLKGFHIPAGTKMPQTQADLAVYVKSLLGQMQTRFTDMSDGLVERIDELGARIDELEHSITRLIDQSSGPSALPRPAPPPR
jgi:heat shock factor-binding protein 1